jgi:hypothetical protein
MTELSAHTTFTIQEAPETLEESVDLVILPENSGTFALRELHYPDDALPPIVYDQNPDKWENFDTEPMTARPTVKGDQTMTDTLLARWGGYQKDRPVKEYWSGDDQKSHMQAFFFRRLWEYFINPPGTGYITWYPKDRTTKGYNIVIENLQAGGDNLVTLHSGAIQGGIIMGEIVFSFRIIGEVAE